MKIYKKNKTALSLIEVMIFLVVTSILMLITMPAVTQRKAQEKCIPGGYIIFDGTRTVVGDKSGLVKIDCTTPSDTNEEICTYLWKAPVKNIYITLVGGGAGGSGALAKDNTISDPCASFIENGAVDRTTYRCQRATKLNTYAYPACSSELHAPGDADYNAKILGQCRYKDSTTTGEPTCDELFGTRYEKNIKNKIRTQFKYEMDSKYVDEMYNAYKAAYDSGKLYNPVTTSSGSNKLECKFVVRDANLLEPCSTGSDGTEIPGGEADCHKKAKKSAVSASAGTTLGGYRQVENTVCGAGGMGGYYAFGPYSMEKAMAYEGTSSQKSSRMEYASKTDTDYEKYKGFSENISRPLVISAGRTYKIVVGAGGKGGKSEAVYSDKLKEINDNHNAKGDSATSVGFKRRYVDVPGQNGGITCIKEEAIAQNDCLDGVLVGVLGGFAAHGSVTDQVHSTSEREHLVSYKEDDETKRSYIHYTYPYNPDSLYEYIDISTQKSSSLDTITGDCMFGDSSGCKCDEGLCYKRDNPPNPVLDLRIKGLTGEFFYTPQLPYPGKVLDDAYEFLMNYFILPRLDNGNRVGGYAPAAFGEPGSTLKPGKGGPSLYGMDRAGSGGDGGYVNAKGELVNGANGKHGLVEIRWYTTCE